MSHKVQVDTDQLRRSAQRLGEVNAGRPGSPATGTLGTVRATTAFDEFNGYWTPAFRAVSESVLSLREALVSAADVYERRDADSAQGFSFSAPRAF